MEKFILMADIIDSSEKDPELLMSHFKKVVKDINQVYGTLIDSPLTITLGDEFQAVVKNLEAGIELIFQIDRALLTSENPYQLRYILHYGLIATPINNKTAHAMMGEGLTQARRSLEKLKHEKNEVIVSGIEQMHAEKLNLAFLLYRTFYNDWPEKDRKTAYDFIEIKDYKKMAKVYKKDVSTMWRKEKSLNMQAFYSAKKLIKLMVHE